VFTSGKGGVGTSNLALNLAIALGEYGQRVVLVDADLGLANIDLLCGMSPPSDLGDVLAARRPLANAIVPGPGEIQIVAGAHGSRTLADVLEEAPARLAREFVDLEANADFLIIDAGSGLNPNVRVLAAAADQAVVVTSPEPTSVADAHAAIQRLSRNAGSAALRSVVNQASSVSEANDVLARIAASSRQFLGTVVLPLGYVRADPRVPLSVRRRRPFLVEYPRSLAANGVRRLARTLIEERRPRARRPGFFAALAARFALGKVAR
jgi:flagellar biosynthesis protein FlhG